MRRIAHLSDVHLLARRPDLGSLRARLAARFVSVGRPLDGVARASKLAEALAAARASGADHFVLTGDLTELGAPDELEHVAEILHAAGLPPDAVTLVPGNHDAYTSPGAWRRALAGPLRAFAAASADAPGKAIVLGDVALLPLDTSTFQHVALASGVFTEEAARAVARRLADPALADRTVLLALHHPPFGPLGPLGHLGQPPAWLSRLHGLRGYAFLQSLLQRHPGVQVLHGHLHRLLDRTLGRTRLFGAPAVVDGAPGRPNLRVYDVGPDGLHARALV
jgi:predicted phosphodiesterase